MNNPFESSVRFINQAVDCRQLTLLVHYSYMSQDAVSSMTEKVLNTLYMVTEDHFVFRWYCNGKVIPFKCFFNTAVWKNARNLSMRIAFDSYVKNPITYNSSTILKFQKELPRHFDEYQTKFSIDPFAEESSIDYPPFFNKLFSAERQSDDQIIDNLAVIFRENERKLLAFHKHPDLCGNIELIPYTRHTDLFYGSIQISFSSFCLGNFVDNMADTFAQLACELSDNFVHLNASIMLQPQDFMDIQKQSPYMRYFGKYITDDGSYNDTPYTQNEWYHTFYLRGVEWFNILGPAAKDHTGVSFAYDNSADVYVRMLNSGALLVRSAKSITQYKYEDALKLKHITKPALFPGKNAFPLRAIYPWLGSQRVYAWCPRNDWAIVPIEKQDINIIGTDIVFRADNHAAK